MIATFTEISKLYTTDVPELPKFKRFVGGIGWGKEDKPGALAKTWLAVFGEQEDSRVMQIAEEFGTLQVIGKKAIDWKDQLLCERFYVNGAELHNQKVRHLRTLEGLTFYKKEKGILREIYPTDTATWPHFRDTRPLTSIIPVPDDIKVDMSAGFSKLHGMATQEHSLIFYGPCEELSRLILKSQIKERKPEETLNHPLIEASVFAVSMLLRTRAVEGEKQKQWRNPYPNRAR